EMNLSVLPSDIIRKIIIFGQEDINSIRQISPEWNSLALDHLTHRKLLPSIKWFYYRVDFDGQTALCMRMLAKYRDYFGVGSWSFTPKYVDVRSGSYFDNIVRHGSSAQFFKLFLSRCSRIERLELKISRVERLELETASVRRREIAIFRDALRDVIVDEIVF
ncbi:hypothetical protein PENTCL1PPCAC_5226, partial [Pristionchus entomophagus]